MRTRDIIKILISLALLALIVFYLYQKGSFAVIYQCSLFDLSVLVLLTFSGYLVAGWQMYYLLRVQNKISLTFPDIILLPFSMSLFAYIIPTNGGLLYSVFFLKKKYNLDSSQGFSIGIFSIYTSFIITGIIGLVVTLMLNRMVSWLTLISVLLIFSPYIILVSNRLFQKITFKKDSFFQKTQVYINRVIISSNDLMLNKKALIITILLNLLLMLILYITYFWLTRIFGITISLISLVFLVLLLRISSLVRVLPANLGIEELFAAGIFSLIGKDPATGMLYALFIRFSAIVLFTPLGIFHTIFNLTHFSLPELRSLFGKLIKKH